jgi:excisionase family DNA binding protein
MSAPSASPSPPAPAQALETEPPPGTWPSHQALLTVRQVAEFLGMTPKAVYHRAERGQLPGVVHVGRSLRFRRTDLLRFIGEGRGLSPTGSR